MERVDTFTPSYGCLCTAYPLVRTVFITESWFFHTQTGRTHTLWAGPCG